MSIIRRGNVALSNLRKTHVALSNLKKKKCHMSLRPKKGSVAVLILGVYTHAVSEIKDFSDAHIGCMDPKTKHPAKYLCTFPYMNILTVQKRHAFQGAWA